MALTREMLKGMGLSEEQISAIISEHVAVTTSLKDQVKELKADAEKLPAVQKELDDLKATGGNWESKYNKEHENFEQYKKDVAEKEALAKVRSVYGVLLKESGIGEKYIDSILRVTDFSNMALGEDGKLKDAEKLAESAKSDYSGFIVTTETHGADTATPPSDGTLMTKEAFEKLPLSERMNYANAHPAEASSFLK